jgi:6-phosphogluconolactonase/glucosamine-6-phosphate isomerase/deaminase
VLQLSLCFPTISEAISTPLSFLVACSVLGLCGWTLVSALFDALSRAKQMHQVPCTKCRFFSGDFRLKCTIHPHTANTEQAIDCPDYRY